MATTTIYLSSTYEDLKDYRGVVFEALRKSGYQVIAMEVTPVMQPVSAGTFQQGNTHGRGGPEEKPVREVTIKKFAIGKFEVTFEEYERFSIAMNRPVPGDQDWDRGLRPVINVSWRDARDYAAWLSKETGKRYRLPTESEWEYAARSEGKDDIWAGTSDESQLKDYAVFRTDRTAPVGEDKGRKPNALGLYDMSGNVWEWVEDCLHNNYNEAPNDGSAWLEATGGNCEGRVIRGGSWNNLPENLHASNRHRNHPGNRNNYIGFRLVQDIEK